MKRIRLTLALAAVTFAPTLAKADPITYIFNQTYAEDPRDYFTVTGTLTTDGKVGSLSASDITGYDLFVNEKTLTAAASTELSAVSSSLFLSGGLSASSGSLSFDYSGANLFNIAGGGGFAGILQYTNLTSTFGDLGIGVVNVSESGPMVIASAATPEPSTLLLLGTGALGVAGAVRRRIGRA